MHRGIDIAVPIYTPVKAAASGTVVSAGPAGGYGNYVVIDHGYDITTRYAHNASFTVKKGDKVKRGQVIALADSTGASTGHHCHFEVIVKEERVDKFIDPRKYLSIKK